VSTLAPAILDAVGAAMGAPVKDAHKLSGGAIQENWRLALADGHVLVLRRSAPSRVSFSLGRKQEFALLAGMSVAEPLAVLDDPLLPGSELLLTRFISGEARGARLVKDDSIDGAQLAEQAGSELARLHRITPPRPDLAFLPLPTTPVLPLRIEALRAALDRLSEPQPVIELGLRHLETRIPSPSPLVLTHGDFRLGNLMVAAGRIAAVLDWEFACWGDAREDLGWFCAPCWRFGRIEREAGGLGSAEEFLRGYGGTYGPDELAWFELLATLRWCVIALQQAERHRSGAERSLELALTATLLPGLERDILDLMETL
jgi:aminoglycoside phosphotransferase (APT) family kinase protein